jgi:predicted HNH restriction endonuclease
MRRWAERNGKPEHKNLLALFHGLAEGLTRGALSEIKVGPAEDDEGHEGELKRLLVRHRKREHKLQLKKIADVMQKNYGHLVCEVPRCGFDFHARYGELGFGFAEVHHKKPLSEAPHRGRSVRLSDLAVVCANCHRMIHHNGQCRALDGLIPGVT